MVVVPYWRYSDCPAQGPEIAFSCGRGSRQPVGVYFNGYGSLKKRYRHDQPVLVLDPLHDSALAAQRPGLNANIIPHIHVGTWFNAQPGFNRRLNGGNLRVLDWQRPLLGSNNGEYARCHQDREALTGIKPAKNIAGKKRQLNIPQTGG